MLWSRKPEWAQFPILQMISTMEWVLPIKMPICSAISVIGTFRCCEPFPRLPGHCRLWPMLMVFLHDDHHSRLCDLGQIVGTISLSFDAILHLVHIPPEFHSEYMCNLEVLHTRIVLSRVLRSKFPVDTPFHSHTVMHLLPVPQQNNVCRNPGTCTLF